MLNINLTPLVVISAAFPAPSASSRFTPKVINITSGLGSIENTPTEKTLRCAPYKISKVGTSTLTAQMQATEDTRIAVEEAENRYDRVLLCCSEAAEDGVETLYGTEQGSER